MLDDNKVLFNENLGSRSQMAFHTETSNPISDLYIHISITPRKIILPKRACMISSQTNQRKRIYFKFDHAFIFYLPFCGLKHFLTVIPMRCHFIVFPLKLPFKSLHVCVHPSLQHSYIFWIIQMNNPASITKPYRF